MSGHCPDCGNTLCICPVPGEQDPDYFMDPLELLNVLKAMRADRDGSMSRLTMAREALLAFVDGGRFTDEGYVLEKAAAEHALTTAMRAIREDREWFDHHYAQPAPAAHDDGAHAGPAADEEDDA